VKTLFAEATQRPLSLRSHRQLSALAEAVSLLPPGAPFASAKRLLQRLDETFKSRGATVGFILRKGEESTVRAPGRIFGWTPGLFLYQDDHAHRAATSQELLRARDFASDEVMRLKVRDAGRLRLFASRGFRRDSALPPGIDGEIFRRLRLVDRMVANLPLGADVEAVVILDRVRGPVFSLEEARLLLAALPVVRCVLQGLGRACGYLDATEPLTSRERDVVRLLLTGMREAAIARALTMSPGALHQRVKAIYLKYQVSSRAELMALWLSGGRQPAAE
jgi:DNA-binding CsgD family transcriptional regulator